MNGGKSHRQAGERRGRALRFCEEGLADPDSNQSVTVLEASRVMEGQACLTTMRS